MGTTIATLLVVFAAASGPGPIAASIARHAADSLAPQMTSEEYSWQRLGRVKAGTEIIVTTDDGVDLKRVFVSSNAAQMTALNLSNESLRRAAPMMRRVASERPELFEADRLAVGFADGRISVRTDGVAIDGQRICDLAAIVERLDRSRVRLVKSPRTAHASTKAVAIATGVGFLVGLGTYFGVGQTCPIDNMPTGCQIGLAAPLWVPVAGGALAYWATRQVDEEIYYRRP